jgi:enoyl-CoA hydratase/carnithine racemase
VNTDVTYRLGMPAVELNPLDDDIACVTLNRPKTLNAIDGSLIDGMEHALDTLEGASGEARSQMGSLVRLRVWR